MVDSKEDYETAMYRELKEELFIDNMSLKEIAYLNPYKNESELFIKLYIGYIDSEIINYDKDGISQIYYFTVNEIDNLLKENPKQFKDNFKFSYNILKEYLRVNKGNQN